jgi:hypothetical protein
VTDPTNPAAILEVEAKADLAESRRDRKSSTAG